MIMIRIMIMITLTAIMIMITILIMIMIMPMTMILIIIMITTIINNNNFIKSNHELSWEKLILRRGHRLITNIAGIAGRVDAGLEEEI